MKMMFIALAAAAMLTGCALTPPLERPASPVPAAYPLRDDPVTDRTAADLGWRTLFNDPALQRLIELALTHNRDLRLAALNVEMVRAQYDVQKAAELPHL
ncbi:hypothetical protein FUT87_03875, partial [Mitsuaria sp. TWR114]